MGSCYVMGMMFQLGKINKLQRPDVQHVPIVRNMYCTLKILLLGRSHIKCSYHSKIYKKEKHRKEKKQ